MGSTSLRVILRTAPWLVIAILAVRGAWAGPTANHPWLHALVAIGTSACAATACRAVLARRSGSARDAAVASGAAMLAGAIFVHAAATPGAIFGENRLVGVSGLTSIMFLAGGALLALLLPARAALRAATRVAVTAGVLVAAVLAAAAVVPGLLDLAPPTVPLGMLVLLVPAAATLVVAGARCMPRFDARREGSVAVEAGCTLLGASLLMHFGPAWTGAFWLSHAFELGGAVLLAVGCSRAFAPAAPEVAGIGAAAEVGPVVLPAVGPAVEYADAAFDAAA